MTGKKGKSGGARQGAGRPCKKISLAAGQALLFSTRTSDGYFVPMENGVIETVDRKTIVVKMKNGDTLTIMH